ncbi:MAG: hypothetical protein IKS24_03495, partial [Bacteroidaceae bacterium]|nr:hypothetical protein [Bacteroidaceae bacterium]
SSTYSIPVCLPSGKGISSIIEQYYLSDSATEQIGGSWSATAPTWQDGKYIWTRSLITYTDNSTVTTSPVCATGHKGDDSVIYNLKPNFDVLLFHSNGDGAAFTPASYTLRCGYIKTDGDTRTVYDYPSSGTFGSLYLLYRIIQANGTPVPTFGGNQPYGWDWIDNNNTGEFKDGNGNLVVPNTTDRIAIDFAITSVAPSTCNDSTNVIAIVRVPIQKISDGDTGATGPRGNRGPALCGPQAWNDCATGYAFKQGAEGEAYVDVVLYNGYYYMCKKSHTKSSTNYPGSSADQTNGYWQLGDSVDLIATKVLLAANAIINFAQTNQILVMKSDGTTVALGLGGGSYPLWIGAPAATNAPFKVDIDGKMKATGAEISGKISAQSLTMPFSAIQETDHTYALDDPGNIVLPNFAGGSTAILRLPDNNSNFNGRRVIVSWPPMRTAMEAPHAIMGRIRCPNKDTGSALYSAYYASQIYSAAGGIAEFICIDSTWWLLNIHSNGVQYIQYT